MPRSGRTPGTRRPQAMQNKELPNMTEKDRKIMKERGRSVSLAAAGAATLLAAAGSATAQDSHELAFTVTGDAGSLFGWSIDVLGDVNGDGVDDFIVGAPEDDTSGDNAGRAAVFSGADGTELYEVLGGVNVLGDQFGASVAGIGDVDGDGVPDFVVGAQTRVLNGLISGGADVFSGADGTKLYSVQGDSAVNFEIFGQAVGAIGGDLDGDGVPDFIVGAPSTSSNPGFARVFSGIDGTELFTVTAGSGGNRFGSSVAGVGDVNDDGVPDFAAGDKEDSGSGLVRIYSGADGSLPMTPGDDPMTETDDGIALVGDINADGSDDFIVGFESDTEPGRAVVFSGMNGSPLLEFDPSGGQNVQLGKSVSGGGDLNGDGVPDVLVGIRNADGPDGGTSNSGAIRAYSGADGAELFTVYGPSAGDGIGWNLGGRGDFNGDGVPDFIGSGRGLGSVFVFTSVAGDDCPADLNDDGTVDADDFFDYLDLFSSGDPGADLTGPGGDPDGVLDADDFFQFLNLFAAGCP